MYTLNLMHVESRLRKLNSAEYVFVASRLVVCFKDTTELQ